VAGVLIVLITVHIGRHSRRLVAVQVPRGGVADGHATR